MDAQHPRRITSRNGPSLIEMRLTYIAFNIQRNKKSIFSIFFLVSFKLMLENVAKIYHFFLNAF